LKCFTANLCNTVRYDNGDKAFTATKRPLANLCNTVRYSDGGKIFTSFKRVNTNIRNTVRQGDEVKCVTAPKHSTTNISNTLLYGNRDKSRTISKRLLANLRNTARYGDGAKTIATNKRLGAPDPHQGFSTTDPATLSVCPLRRPFQHRPRFCLAAPVRAIAGGVGGQSHLCSRFGIKNRAFYRYVGALNALSEGNLECYERYVKEHSL